MNYIRLLFSLMTTVIILFGSLINVYEEYLPVFFVQTFRYGKFAYQGEKSVLPVIEVPKAWFKHFYKLAVVVQSFVLLLVCSTYLFDSNVPKWFLSLLSNVADEERIAYTSATQTFLVTVLLSLQIFRRYYDTHYISIFGKKSKINFTQYIVGMVHYPLCALALLSEAPKFAQSSVYLKKIDFFSLGVLDISAILLFFWAWYHQYKCNVILANLRKNNKGIVVTDAHKLPEGDWFDYLSAPHQTAEILIYLSLTIILRLNITWAFVFAWVLTNQVETILLSHWWYQETFDKFPKTRKALIPFIY